MLRYSPEQYLSPLRQYCHIRVDVGRKYLNNGSKDFAKCFLLTWSQVFKLLQPLPLYIEVKNQHDPAPVSLTQLQRQVAKIERPTTDRSTTKIMPHSTCCNVKLSKRHACMTTIKTPLEVPPSVIRDYSYGLVNSKFPTFIT